MENSNIPDKHEPLPSPQRIPHVYHLSLVTGGGDSLVIACSMCCFALSCLGGNNFSNYKNCNLSLPLNWGGTVGAITWPASCICWPSPTVWHRSQFHLWGWVWPGQQGVVRTMGLGSTPQNVLNLMFAAAEGYKVKGAERATKEAAILQQADTQAVVHAVCSAGPAACGLAACTAAASRHG